MPLIQQYLRRDVLGGAANGVGPFCNYLGEPEVDQFEVPVGPNHNVLRLQVPVHDVLALHVFENRHDLRPVKRRLLRVEIAHAPVVREQVAALQELRHEVNVPLLLHEPEVFHLNENNIKAGGESLTMKGWLSFSRIFFSFSMWSTCFDCMMSTFFMALMATLAFGFLFSHANFTFPNAPIQYKILLFILIKIPILELI